jgi:predicted DNA-binding ribbon-helix-helix protein
MRVHIENDLYISADGRQYTLERRSVTQSGENAGKEIYSSIGYFSPLQGAINALVKLKIADSTATTLKELIAQIDQIHLDIKAAVYI